MKHLFVLFLLLSATVALHAAGVRHINVSDGLASRQVYEIEEDNDGFIWIYTNYGLDRYDGHNMKHYPLTDQQESNDHILSATSMLRSPGGQLWVALKSGVLYRYDNISDSFVKELAFTRRPELRIYHFAFGADSTIVVGTDNGAWASRPGGEPRQAWLPGVLVNAICPDGNGGYFAGTDRGVFQLVKEGITPRLLKGSEGMYVKSLEMSGPKLFIGTFSRGVYTYDTRRPGSQLHILPYIPAIPVNALVATAEGNILAGIDGAGVFRIDSDSEALIDHYHEDDTPDRALSGNTVTDVHTDRNNGIWIATSHKGLNYIPPTSRSVRSYRARGEGTPSLGSDYVNVIYEAPDSVLWFGTDNGLSSYDRRTGRWRQYMRRNNYVANVVLAVSADRQGRIWAGTYGDGVSIIDPATGTSRHFTPGDTAMTEYVFVTRTDSYGDVWIGGINGRLGRYTPATGITRCYDEDCIASITPDLDGSMLFGGNKGVGRYNRDTDSFSWQISFDTVTIRHRFPVRTIQPARDSSLWISTTGDGLIHYDRRRGTARRYTTADGLSSNTVYSAVPDTSGMIWVSTETDLYKLNPATGKLTTFTYYIGAERGQFNPGAAIVTSDGTVVLGTAEGCYSFNPAEEIGNIPSSDILLTDFKLHDRHVEPGAEGSPLSVNINHTDAIRLKSSQNSIEVSFALIDFSSPNRAGFEYMLENHDKAYIQAGSANSVRYAELEPGDYTLHLRAIDRSTGLLLASRDLDIRIDPPLWLTWWAKVLYLVLAAGIITLIIRQRHLRARERHIEGQIQSFAAIAHDIRTPMSLIKEPLNNIEQDNSLSDSSRASLSHVRASVDKTMGLLSQMLELRRDTGHAPGLTVQSCDIGEYLRMKVEDYRMLAVFKGIDIRCEVPEDMPQVMIDPDKFDHIVDNLISNALKYTSEGSVTLGAEPMRFNRWKLTVADTGIGISRADARHIFKRRHRSSEAMDSDAPGMGLGLLITHRLVRLHHGAISFESAPGKGTVFSVVLPRTFSPGMRKEQTATRSASRGTSGGELHISDEASDRSRIFIVEDNPEMLAYLESTLGTEYDVQAFADPMQVLEAVREVSPDLIITDIMMPRLRGDELCRLIKTDMATSHIPVLLLTGLAGREDIIAGLEARADDYIIKPFDIIVLKARIRNIIKSRRLLSRRVLAEDCEPANEDFANELDRQFMEKVMESVNAHMADSEFSVSDLCADLGMSRTSVYNKIKSLSGQSLNEFIRIMRLNKAKELLATRRHNISEVAYMVGFSDPKYFSTCFKKQFGISPSKV